MSISHSGGSLSADGTAWKLLAQGNNVSTSRQFATGAHAISIFAKASTDQGTFPIIRLSLNGVQIGSDITVSNTSAMKEYVVNYSVSTANQKSIKVELVNVTPRSVSIDGVNVYCPRPKVACGSNLSCDLCCVNMLNGSASCQEWCNAPLEAGAICDQPSDCGTGNLCSMITNGQQAAMLCRGPADLPSPGNAFNREICKSPTQPEWSCTQGGTCQDSGAPGWKTCQCSSNGLSSGLSLADSARTQSPARREVDE